MNPFSFFVSNNDFFISLEIYICLVFALIAYRFTNKKNLLFALVVSMFVIPFIIIYLDLTTLNLFKIPDFQEWIMNVPATAGSRAIMIGIALGTIAQS